MQNLEAKISLTNGDNFGSIVKTAFGPCKCNRRFVLTCRKDGGMGDENSEKIQFSVETLMTHSELLVSIYIMANLHIRSYWQAFITGFVRISD